MRPQKRAERTRNKALEFLAKHGVKQEVLEQVANDPVVISRQAPGLQAEAVLLYLHNANHFVAKLCKYCEARFMTNYNSVAYCSDRCRAKALEKMGIKWDPTLSPEQRWAMQGADGTRLKVEPPLVIPSEAIPAMLAAEAQKKEEVAAQQTQVLAQDVVEESEPQRHDSPANPLPSPFSLELPQFSF